MPLLIPVSYFLILPRPEAFAALPAFANDEADALDESLTAPYTPLPTDDDDVPIGPKSTIALSAADKWYLVRPLLLKYMLPLCECHRPFIHD